MSFSLHVATQPLANAFLIHVCMFRENRRVKGGGGLLFSQPHPQASPGGVTIKSANRQNIEHSRLEHFICFQNPRQGWCGEVGEDHP